MSIVLLEEPLPPVDDQTVEQLDMSLANQVVKFIEFQAGPPDGPVPEVPMCKNFDADRRPRD